MLCPKYSSTWKKIEKPSRSSGTSSNLPRVIGNKKWKDADNRFRLSDRFNVPTVDTDGPIFTKIVGRSNMNKIVALESSMVEVRITVR